MQWRGVATQRGVPEGLRGTRFIYVGRGRGREKKRKFRDAASPLAADGSIACVTVHSLSGRQLVAWEVCVQCWAECLRLERQLWGRKEERLTPHTTADSEAQSRELFAARQEVITPSAWYQTTPTVCTDTKKKTKLCGLSLRANYTDRATAACRWSYCQLLRIEGCRLDSAADPYGRILGFLDNGITKWRKM
jgi:hypothetical protein